MRSRVLMAAAAVAFLASPSSAQFSHTILGPAAGDNFGSEVAGAGDVNGDGFEDVVIGSPFADPSGLINAGQAFVHSGLDGTLIHTFNGGAFLDLFGRSVAGVGDLNNDGKAEVAVGAFFADSNGPEAGTVDVFDGATGLLFASINGTNTGDQMGQSVAAAGDVNQDGVPDLLVGAWAADGAGGANSGEVLVVSGTNFQPIYTFQGAGAGDNFGIDLDGIGDADNDGFVDVAIGAWAADAGGANTGTVTIHSGQTGFLHQVIPGTAAGDEFGASLGGIGDLNLDGVGDLVVGAPGRDGPAGVDAGAAYVLSGSNAAQFHVFDGIAAGEQFGNDVAGAGDRNADGFADVIVGVQFRFVLGANQGAAIVFDGEDGSIMRSYFGAAAGDRFGRSVGGRFDADGDGVSDIAIGSPANDIAGGDAGMVRVFFECLVKPKPYGAGCTGSGSFTPSLSLTGCTKLGGAVNFSINGGLGGSITVLMLGQDRASIPVGAGCDLLITPVAFSLPLPLGGVGPGNGSVAFASVIPVASPPGRVTMQAYILDPGAALGASVTNGIEINIP